MSDPISASNSSAGTYTATESSGSSSGSITESMTDFYKLLTTQLTNQNPLEPMKETDFLGQMAQFSSVEQLEALTGGMKTSQAEQRWLASQNLIGREVVWNNGGEDAIDQSGTVDSAFRDDEGIWLQIGDKKVSPDLVQSVEGEARGSFNVGVF